jgi:hypothetical protein
MPDRPAARRTAARPERRVAPSGPSVPFAEGNLLRLQRLAGNAAVTSIVLQAGRPPPAAAPRGAAPASRPGPGLRIQRHSSWEHKLLGDVNPKTLQVITKVNEFEGKSWMEKWVATATGKGVGKEKIEAVHALKEQLDILEEWQSSPPAPGTTTWKGLTLVTIHLDEGSAVTLTLGEMNTIADYYGNIGQLKRGKVETLTRILQTIRRESWTQIHRVLGQIDPKVAQGLTEPRFPGAVMTEGLEKEIDLERLTDDKRNKQSETYLSNATRNACHFAPQSWYRWKEHHEKARDQARMAWRAKQLANQLDNESLKKVAADLSNEAIMTNGFGDHYLQDSFAAGHLINKILIMQWFVEWLGTNHDWIDKVMGPVGTRWIAEWGRVKRMTSRRQPGLAGMELYDRPKSGKATDPQSAEEMPTKAERIERLGLEGPNPEEAYRNYLAMLDNAAIQLATKLLHDHFCQKGLEVYASGKRIGLVYGDDNMIRGGEGVEYSAETARKSQGAITDLLKGVEPEPTEAIMDRLPNEVKVPGGKGEVVSLKEWHTGGKLKAFCDKEIFPNVKYRLTGRVLPPTLGKVSQDLPSVRRRKVFGTVVKAGIEVVKPIDMDYYRRIAIQKQKQLEKEIKEVGKAIESVSETAKKGAAKAASGAAPGGAEHGPPW